MQAQERLARVMQRRIQRQSGLPGIAPPALPALPPLPRRGTATWLALVDMVEGPLTTLDWIRNRENWKLGDAVYQLANLGWGIESECVVADGREVEMYWLTDSHLQHAKNKLEQA